MSTGYRVCTIDPGTGAAVVTAPIPDDLLAAHAYATAYGGEVVSAALVAALRRGDAPPPGEVPANEFRRRLLPLRVGMALHPDEATRKKWDAIWGELGHFTVIYPGVPPVSDLLALAVADGLLTQAQADAAAA